MVSVDVKQHVYLGEGLHLVKSAASKCVVNYNTADWPAPRFRYALRFL